MSDYEKYIQQFLDFLESDQKIMLITGLDDDAKIRMVLNGLNKKFNSGMIRCSELGRIAMIINQAFNNSPLPQKINGQKLYPIGNMKVRFSKYIDSMVNYPIGDQLDFVIYFPIETVLMPGKEKYLEQLLNNIEHTVSTKTILMTTNDPRKNMKVLRDMVDEHLHYDIANDNPELLETVKSNLGELEYPYFG